MLATHRIEHYHHYKLRFEEITDHKQMPDDVLFNYFLHAEMMRVKRELEAAEKLVVLNQYIAWYAEHHIAIPHPEWVEKNKKRWSENPS